jgi:dTDP-4-amino-4,6-dideoxygalactose transaminase
MEFVDLAIQQKRIRDKIEANIERVLNHGKYIMGSEVQELEEKLASYVRSKHAIGCASGTDALLLGLMAYDIGPGDAVFTSPFTFIATAEVISLLGAVPVFVDINSTTFNLDPEQLKIATDAFMTKSEKRYPLPLPALTQVLKPRGIIAVDLFGLPADYKEINQIAKDCNLFVIEDAAQSFGAEYRGEKACFLAEVGCTSFFPAKPLGCYGDGGMVFIDDDHIAGVIKSIRVHGMGNDKYDNVRIGMNGRLDTLQAAILLAKLEIFEEELEMRQQVANLYTYLLNNIDRLVTPWVPEGSKSAWAQYSILFKTGEARNRCQEKMKMSGIPTAIYYPRPLHVQTAFSHLGYKPGDFPVSEDIAKRILSLPMHPYLKPEEQERVVSTILK